MAKKYIIYNFSFEEKGHRLAAWGNKSCTWRRQRLSVPARWYHARQTRGTTPARCLGSRWPSTAHCTSAGRSSKLSHGPSSITRSVTFVNAEGGSFSSTQMYCPSHWRGGAEWTLLCPSRSVVSWCVTFLINEVQARRDEEVS